MRGTPEEHTRIRYGQASYPDSGQTHSSRIEEWGRRTKRLILSYGFPSVVRFAAQAFCSEYLARIRGSRFFKIGHVEFQYRPSYGTNERIVEVPYFVHFIQKYQAQRPRVLEVGNVLRQETSYPRDVVDKYETASGIINEDVASFIPEVPYDLIVSVSTIEHVGWDEPSGNPEDALTAIRNLYSNCLVEGGRMLISVPLGYNPAIDEFFCSERAAVGESIFLARTSYFNEWVQVPFDVRWRTSGFPRYSSRYMAANLLAFWEVRKSQNHDVLR